jgi:hypothetical protein
MAIDLREYFDAFDREITMDEPQIGRMDSAISAISKFLQDRYDLSTPNFFLQGSYPNRTIVEPPDGGEYDVDLVAYCVASSSTADDALNVLENHFKSDGRYANRLVRKKPCIRLEYASDDVGKFHVDVVPVRTTGLDQPPYEAPRRGDGWHQTAPQEYTAWCLAQGEAYGRTVKALKRWRDTQQSVRKAIKSIVLQVLVAEYMPAIENDATRLAGTITALHEALEGRQDAPIVVNPVLDTENLAARWEPASFQSFVTELRQAKELVIQAEATSDLVEAVDAWREVLGDAFPAPEVNTLGLHVSDTSHEQGVGFKGWRMGLDPLYDVQVTATVQRGTRGRSRHKYESGGPAILAGKKICFKAHARRPGHADVWWQVTNTGGHAREEQGLRGTFLTAKSLSQVTSSDPTEHWESTEYTGSHLVRALLVRDGVVVASSPQFQVNIWNKGRRFVP